MEEMLLAPGGPRASRSGGLVLARLASPPSLSSAVQPVPLATRSWRFFQWQPCWAQGFEPEMVEGGPGRQLGWSWGPAEAEIPRAPEPRAQPSSGLPLAATWTRASGQRVALAPATPGSASRPTQPRGQPWALSSPPPLGRSVSPVSVGVALRRL